MRKKSVESITRLKEYNLAYEKVRMPQLEVYKKQIGAIYIFQQKKKKP